jgi:hypothetical protein
MILVVVSYDVVSVVVVVVVVLVVDVVVLVVDGVVLVDDYDVVDVLFYLISYDVGYQHQQESQLLRCEIRWLPSRHRQGQIGARARNAQQRCVVEALCHFFCQL